MLRAAVPHKGARILAATSRRQQHSQRADQHDSTKSSTTRRSNIWAFRNRSAHPKMGTEQLGRQSDQHVGHTAESLFARRRYLGEHTANKSWRSLGYDNDAMKELRDE